MSPYKALYDREATTIPSYSVGSSNIEALDMNLQLREERLRMIKSSLERTQKKMKNSADKHRKDVEFDEGQWVLVKLAPYRQLSVANILNNNLSQRYFGPYQIKKKISVVAYKTALPQGSLIHDVFYIFKLKKFTGNSPTMDVEQPIIAIKNQSIIYALAITDSRRIYVGNKQVEQVLVQWSGALPEDSSWVEPKKLKHMFPSIQL